MFNPSMLDLSMIAAFEKPYKLVIYDFDNTIFDSIGHALARLGKHTEPSLSLLKEINSGNNPKHDKISKYVFSTDGSDFGEFLYPNISETIETLRNQGVKISIVNNSSKYRIESILTKTNLLDKMDFILGHEDTEKHKPNPEPLYKTLNHFYLKPTQALFVGDWFNDIEAANSAQIDVVLFLPKIHREYQSEECLQGLLKANYLKKVTSHEQILELIPRT